jgi:hypothetical protein
MNSGTIFVIELATKQLQPEPGNNCAVNFDPENVISSNMPREIRTYIDDAFISND